jgi:hypothetical protein
MFELVVLLRLILVGIMNILVVLVVIEKQNQLVKLKLVVCGIQRCHISNLDYCDKRGKYKSLFLHFEEYLNKYI